MKKIRGLIIGVVAIIVLNMALLLNCKSINAAELEIGFDKNEYQVDKGDSLTVNMTINCDEVIGDYYIELFYDKKMIDITSGAENVLSDSIVIQGYAVTESITYQLDLDAIKAGETAIYVKNAKIGGNRLADIDKIDYVPIHIGSDNSMNNEDNKPYSIPVVSMVIDSSKKTHYVINLSHYVPEECEFEYKTMPDVFNGKRITFLTDKNNYIKFLYVLNDDLKASLYAYDIHDGELYPCFENGEGQDKKYIMSYKVINNSDKTMEIIKEKNKNNIVASMDLKGNVTYSRLVNNQLYRLDEKTGMDTSVIIKIIAVVVIIVAVIVFVIVMILINKRKEADKKIYHSQKYDADSDDNQDEWIDWDSEE